MLAAFIDSGHTASPFSHGVRAWCFLEFRAVVLHGFSCRGLRKWNGATGP